ncbi:cell surface protein [Methanosarcina barkeri str. Wiesmoor]|uniref:Cell surface protein n=2 Tax=Methanosarcina barkeri TaxID=2208 RepID=A0A0E3QJD7_METBA|nr:cell surface protein [Methanosarcina barkeri str. Wiesmoor]
MLLLLVFSVVLAAAVNDNTDNTVQTNETRITASGCVHENGCVYENEPKIFDDKIVWGERYSNSGNNIYMYDFYTSKETQITTSGSAYDPDIYGDRIVYIDNRNALAYSTKEDIYLHDIYMYDLSTKKETQITTSGKAWINPDIYGDKIVWQEIHNQKVDIYMYNLSTKKEIQITNSGSAISPAIYGNRIVYTDKRDGNDDWLHGIYIYNLSTNKKMKISNNGPADHPSIYKDRIVWENTTFYSNGYGNEVEDHNIYMYDLSTKKETQITSSLDDQTSPDIYGDKIVWEEDGGKDAVYTNHGIYMYDISTNKKTRISASGSVYQPIYIYDISTNKKMRISASGSTYPAIFGNKIVWEYEVDNKYYVYMVAI